MKIHEEGKTRIEGGNEVVKLRDRTEKKRKKIVHFSTSSAKIETLRPPFNVHIKIAYKNEQEHI